MNAIVVVDGYSTGKELVKILKELGSSCLHIQSIKEIPQEDQAHFDASPYEKNFGFLGDVNEAHSVLAQYAPLFVIAGSDSGVSYAEELAHTMHLATNDFRFRQARRDKFFMIERLKESHLLTAEQRECFVLDDALSFADKYSFPLVLKPTESAGSDGVSVCYSREDIEKAFLRTMNKMNIQGTINDKMVIQTFVDGPQYTVNSVSIAGEHYITDIWELETQAIPHFAYAQLSIDLVDPQNPTLKEMISYTKKMLTALGINNTAAHSELRITHQGPVLIETNVRIMGGTLYNEAYLEAGLIGSHAAAFANRLLKLDDFYSYYGNEKCYSFKKMISKNFFYFTKEGHISSIPEISLLKTLPSFFAFFSSRKKGDYAEITTTTIMENGALYLVHEDSKQIKKDKAQLRKWERDGQLYLID